MVFFLKLYLSAAIMIEAIYELTRAKMKETEIDGVPRTKNQVCCHLQSVKKPHKSVKSFVSIQEIRHKLAKMKVDAAQMRLLTDYGIHQYAIGEMDQQTASMAQYITCEKLMEVNHVVSFQVFHVTENRSIG